MLHVIDTGGFELLYYWTVSGQLTFFLF